MNFVMITWSQNKEEKQNCYMNTDTFIGNIKIKEIYVDIAKVVETRFDTSNYELD